MTRQHGVSVLKSVKINVPQRMYSFILVLSVLLSTVACMPTTTPYNEQMSSAAPEPKVILSPGDEIEVKFPYWAELNDVQTIRPDNLITLQLVGAVSTKGLTPEELTDKLMKLYESKIKNPVITVVVRSLVDQRIYVGGEVYSPGLLTLQGKVSVLQAVINAGGFKDTAKLDYVIVIRKGKDNKPVPYRVDVTKSLSAANHDADFVLQPNDVVYVPKTFIANANQFVNQYVANLFLFRGVGLGFSYDLNHTGYR